MIATLVDAKPPLIDKKKFIRLEKYSDFKLEGNMRRFSGKYSTTNYQTRLRQQDYTSKVGSGGSFQIFNSVVSSSSTAGYSTE